MALGEGHIQQLVNRARREPSLENWRQISETLARLVPEDLGRVIPVLREPLKSWPAEIRRETIYSSGSAWLKDLFRGELDARLELVGWADISHRHDFENPDLCGTEDYVEAIYPIVKIFARALDPAFDPPDTVLTKESEYTAAAGCGGGFDSQKRGNDKQGTIWYDKIDESPSGNDPSTGDWSPYGLAGGYELHIGRRLQYKGYYTFSVSGPAPKVFEVALAWGALLRGGKATPATATAALADSRDIFQNFEAYSSCTAIETVTRSPGELPSPAADEKVTRPEKKERTEAMSKVYQKIINPRSGAPCCPECGSAKVYKAEGAGTPSASFVKVRCENCGYEAWEDEERVYVYWGLNELPYSPAGSRVERTIKELRDDEFRCPKCASTRVTVRTIAPQSGNSADYYFFECGQCHYKDDLVDGDADASSCAWVRPNA